MSLPVSEWETPFEFESDMATGLHFEKCDLKKPAQGQDVFLASFLTLPESLREKS
jgi:hypothetical protein